MIDDSRPPASMKEQFEYLQKLLKVKNQEISDLKCHVETVVMGRDLEFRLMDQKMMELEFQLSETKCDRERKEPPTRGPWWRRW